MVDITAGILYIQMVYNGRLAFLIETQRFLVIAYLALALALMASYVFLFSFLDVLLSHNSGFVITTAFCILVALGIGGFIIFRNLKERSIKISSALYLKKRSWLQYSPAFLVDYEEKRMNPSVQENGQEFYAILSDTIETRNKRMLDEFSLLEITRILLGNKKWIFIFPVIFLVLNLVFGLNPVRLLLPYSGAEIESIATVSPAGGEFFYGTPLTIRVELKNHDFKLMYFEKETRGDFNFYSDAVKAPSEHDKVYLLRIPFLSEELKLRPVFRRGIEVIRGRVNRYSVIEPAHIKRISFKITAPSYTGISPFQTTDNLNRVYYGSLIEAEIEASVDSTAVYNEAELKARTLEESKIFQHIFRFRQLSAMKVFYNISSKTAKATSEIKSPVYEFWPAEDAAPEVSILSSENPGVMKLPEKGELTFDFSVKDDFGIRLLMLVVIEKGRVVYEKPIDKSMYQEKAASGGVLLRGTLTVDLSKIEAQQPEIMVAARDNSLIPSSFSWQNKLSPGQTGQSRALQVEFPDNAKEKQEWKEESYEKMTKDLTIFQKEYADSEDELKEIMKAAQAKQDVQKLEGDLKKWAEKRKNLKKNLEQFQKQLDKNVSADSDLEHLQKQQALKNIARALEEKISEREKELNKLMQKFPNDYMVAAEKMKKMQRKEYLKGLENSIAQIKSFLP